MKPPLIKASSAHPTPKATKPSTKETPSSKPSMKEATPSHPLMKEATPSKPLMKEAKPIGSSPSSSQMPKAKPHIANQPELALGARVDDYGFGRHCEGLSVGPIRCDHWWELGDPKHSLVHLEGTLTDSWRGRHERKEAFEGSIVFISNMRGRMNTVANLKNKSLNIKITDSSVTRISRFYDSVLETGNSRFLTLSESDRLRQVIEKEMLKVEPQMITPSFGTFPLPDYGSTLRQKQE
ncbi:hypothetical protein Syun_011880 [Stephania yunnanensis]|uniref:Uncharacterized protein n=1 Tax=Stephania yunnanensis TaxID=152371 RepID=A0AAP0PII0_9MAGN